MNQLCYKVFILFFAFSFFHAGEIISQDTLKSSQYSDSPIKKGNWAIVFELGTLFGKQSALEEYSFLLKYHTGDNTAFRINISFNGVESDDNYSGYEEYGKYSLQGNITFQYFITKKYFAKPFVSIGPYFLQNYEKQNSLYGYAYKNNSWELGAVFTIGAEALIHKYVGIIGEYIFRGYYGKKTSFHSNYDSNGEASVNVYKIKANSCRFGVSLYF